MGTRRPPNRKAQIRSTAAELFLEHGYHNVSVTDVAGALGITASALYHHYRNKQDLLLHAVLDDLDAVDTLIGQAAGLDEALHALAALVVGPRGALAVWEREARYLEGAQREAILARQAEVAAHFAPLVRAERPEISDADAELLAWAVLGALGSRSRHRSSLSRRRDEQLMHHLGAVTAHCELPEHDRPEPQPATGRNGAGAGLRRPRRDQLLAEAIRLFDERGYQSITMADIGEAAGIVASGVYRHFPGKTDILVAAMNRGGERMRAGAEQALEQARDPEEALELLLRAHITICVEHMHLVGILTHERDQLPEKERTALRRFQADYLTTWVEALGAARPEREQAELKTIINAVHGMIYFIVRSGRIRFRPGLEQQLCELGSALLRNG
ncbi:TetR/AcrR family transcriptional regulator [Streptomyces sp. NPDC056390]|uniref:TetR/AcrR family transcriptional regulator n=1 Tax=Streptomyces sp. NPDC056390 TaxID=3345806 RepID=UPI0035DC91F9